MVKYILILIIFALFISYPPRRNNELENDVLVGASGSNDMNLAYGMELNQVIFPIWWVMPGYQTGGSETVVVFANDHQVYSRTQRNSALTPTGATWEYDNTIKCFSISASSNIRITDDPKTNKWDGLIHHPNGNLVPGSPDYTIDKIQVRWMTHSDVQVYNGGWMNVPLAMADLNSGGEIRLATGDTNDNCKYLLSFQPSIVPETWSISPLGDEVKIVGGKGGGLRIEYQNVQLCLVAEYYEFVQGFLAIPPATKPNIFSFGGLKATLHPTAGPG